MSPLHRSKASPCVKYPTYTFSVEVSHHAKIAEPKLVVTSPECYDSVVKGLRTARNDSKIIIVEQPNTKTPNGTIKYSEIAENGKADYTLLDKIERKEDDLAIIPFSSGTTGLPKGVEITYKNILAAVDIMERKENCFPELACSKYKLYIFTKLSCNYCIRHW